MQSLAPVKAGMTFTFCALSSVAIGFLCHGTSILDTNLIYFQFVAGGVLCGALAAAGETRGPRAMILVSLVAVPLVLAFNRSHSSALILRDTTWVTGLAVAVWLGLVTRRTLPIPALGRCALWGAIFGVVHWSMFVTLSKSTGTPISLELAQITARLGALIGVGIGFGHELSERARGQ